MLLSPQITECSDCLSLKEMMDKIDCSMYNLIKNKSNNENYSTESHFSMSQFSSLSHYKRIIGKRIFNPSYPSSDTAAQDLISQATKLLYGDTECSKCVNCDPMDNSIPSDTTSTSTTSTTTIID